MDKEKTYDDSPHHVGKVLATGKITTLCVTAEKAEELSGRGWLPVVNDDLAEPPLPDIDEETFRYYSERYTHRLSDDGTHIIHYRVWDINPVSVNLEVRRAQAALAASDYKIIKMLEYSMLPASLDSDSDVPMPPYDIETLHAERQEIRNEINRLKQLLNNNGI